MSSKTFKRLKCSPTAAASTKDRISELPEALIIHIISLLPTRDGIKTGSLSKRWEGLWTRFPKLYFDGEDFFGGEDKNDDFIHHVTETLVNVSCSKIKSFGVKLYYAAHYESHIYAWTKFANRHVVDKFELDFCPMYVEKHFLLPSYLYTNSSFRELKFKFCRFDNASRVTVSWNSLKKLSLYEENVSNKVLENILAGTPLLEILDVRMRMYQCTDTSLSFHHPSLKKLILSVLDDEAGSVVPELDISAPKLESLELEGNFKMSKLVDATLTLNACSMLCLNSFSQHDNSNIDPLQTSQDVASNYFTQLSTVKFNNFWCFRTLALPFVQLLLRYAKVLQKMVIYLEGTYHEDFGTEISESQELQTISEISQKVLTFQRSSPDAQVYVYLR